MDLALSQPYGIVTTLSLPSELKHRKLLQSRQPDMSLDLYQDLHIAKETKLTGSSWMVSALIKETIAEH